MAITISGILCDERVHEFREQASLQGGFQARKGFICNWSDRFTVMRGLLGISSYVTIGGAITINAPAAYPELPGIYCTGIEVEPHGKPTQGVKQLQYEKCTVWASYGCMPWSFGGIEMGSQIDQGTPILYATQEFGSSCEWLTVPGSGLQWKTTTKALQQGAGIRLALTNFSITLHQMAYMPTVQATLFAGLSNKYTYMGVDPGMLLYDGVTTNTQFNIDGTHTRNGTYAFTARPIPWDHQYDPAQKKFDQVQIGQQTTGWRSIIPREDFNWIIPTSYSLAAPVDPRPLWPPEF